MAAKKPKNQVSFAGTIDSILWQDPSTQRALVRLKGFADSNSELGDSTVCSGYLADLQPGMYIRGKGLVRRNTKGSKELYAKAFTAHFPRLTPDVLTYLKASKLPFISSTGAGVKLMYAMNGGAAPGPKSLLLHTLAAEPAKLKADGFSYAMLDKASEEMRKEADRITAINELVQYTGVSRDRAINVTKKIPDPMSYLAANPYQAAVLFGVDFKTCDEIAERLDYGNDHKPDKMFAALTTVFQSKKTHGSMGVDLRDLRDGLKGIFDNEKELQETIDSLRYTPLYMNTRIGDRELVQTQSDFEVEQRIARELNRLATAESVLSSPDNWEITAPEHQSQEASDQRKGILMALKSNVSILTGGPGTGKTTTVRTILNMLEGEGKKDGTAIQFSLSAPSGLAGKRLADSTKRQAKTIHKTLQYGHNGQPTRNKENPVNADVVVIDEGSMLDAEIFARALEAVPTGAKVLIVGDPDQLPSVSAGNVLEDLISAKNSLIPSTKLATPFRNAGPIAHNAHAINRGEMPEISGSPRSNQAPNQPWNVWMMKSDAEKRNMVRWLVETEIPQNCGVDPYDIQVLSPQHGGPLGTDSLNKMLQDIVNPMGPGKMELNLGMAGRYRTGDKIIYLANTPEKELVNGDIGLIQSVNPRAREMVVRFVDRDVKLSGKNLFQTKLAYCLTIHKSQGSEYPAAILPMSESHHWTRQLFYTGITRGKGHVYTLTDPKTLETAVNDSKRVQRITGLPEAVNVACESGSNYEVRTEMGMGLRTLVEKQPEPPKAAPRPTVAP